MSKRKPIVQTSALDAYYVGDDSDGAYYQVAKGRKGWYVTVWGRRCLDRRYSNR